MDQKVMEMFGLKTKDGQIFYKSEQIEVDDFIRMAMEYEILLNENKKLNGRIDKSLEYFRKMTATIKELEQKTEKLESEIKKLRNFAKQEKLL